MQEKFPCLFSYAQSEDISVANFCSANNISDLFHPPLSPEAYSDLELIQEVVNEDIEINSNEDVWSYEWGAKFTSKKFYNFCFRNTTPPAPFQWIWKSKLWPRLKFFAWQLLSDRLSTRDLLKRKNLNIGTTYVSLEKKKRWSTSFSNAALVPHVGYDFI
jgi:hypothetical protein